ncbi:DNA phosphorothioation-associated protein 4 [Phormidesmis sp. 146-33]
MADHTRIKVAKDKAYLVRSLTASDTTTGPFETYADVLAFAATVGIKHRRRVPLISEVSKSEPSPIHRETFSARGYDMVMNLIAVADSADPKILASNEASSAERSQAFEEYANGGLEVLEEMLKGTVDHLEQILLLLGSEGKSAQLSENEFDLSAFLPV